MVNASKLRDSRFLKKWWASGAIPQPTIPEKSMIIPLSLVPGSKGTMREILIVGIDSDSENYFLTGYELIVVVPASRVYVFGTLLKKVPGNAIPARLFYTE